MWKKLGESVLRNRFVLLAVLALLTAFMAWQASKVQLSYEFAKAIPTDHPKYIAYQAFKQKFGEDGNLLVVGVQTPNLFQQALFNDYAALHGDLKKIRGVEDVVSLPYAVNLVKNEATEKLGAAPVFNQAPLTQVQIDSSKAVFFSLPFYKGLLYNAETSAWLMGVRINRDVLNSSARSRAVNDIKKITTAFGQKHQLEMHLSGLPLIRTSLAVRLQHE
ncbi:MAG TPA: hypothetical protein VM010_03480, partial [Chitinophagaceae bacterium]|nr:hypothetical protein [Chitinophagaceae bacterium]